MKSMAGLALLLASLTAAADEQLRVSSLAWSGLTVDERAQIQRRFSVELKDTGSYGLIIDAQGVNESTPATTGGATLGGAIAEASYIDRAFKPGNNYSAKGQLGAMLLGSVIGSALDRQAVQQFHYRYALRLADGEIRSVDSVQSSPFRHPAGLCVSLPELTQLPQAVCAATTDQLRKQYLTSNAPSIPVPIPDPAAPATPAESVSLVMCRLGNLAPVSTSAEKCASIGGLAK